MQFFDILNPTARSREKIRQLELRARLKPSEQIFIVGKRVHEKSPDFSGHVQSFGFTQMVITTIEGMNDVVDYASVYIINETVSRGSVALAA